MAQATNSTSSAHTAYPWKKVSSWEIEGKNGETICRMSPTLPSVNKDMSIQEADANTRLIIAAPDLLAACKDALNWFTGNNEETKLMAQIEQSLKDAIAKAEGRA